MARSRKRTTKRRKTTARKRTTTARKPPLGSGARFRAMTDSGMSPALAAWIGRNKYGNAKYARMSAAGRRRATRSR